MKKFLALCLFILTILACNTEKKVIDNQTATLDKIKVDTAKNYPDAFIVINGKPYYREDFLNYIYFNYPDLSEKDFENDNITKPYLDKFIDFILLYQDASKNNVKIDEEKYTEMVNRIKKLNDESYVVDLPISFDIYKKLLKKNLIIKEWINQLISKNINIDEEEVKKRFDNYSDTLKLKYRYHVLHIVTMTYKEAAKARRELIRGKKFSEVAKKYSVGPEKENNGDLGFILLDDMPEVFSHIKKLRLKRISKIYKSKFGYHIFKVVEKKKINTNNFEVLKPRIYQEIFAEKVDSFLKKYIAGLRKNAKIKINYSSTNFNGVDNNSTGKNNK